VTNVGWISFRQLVVENLGPPGRPRTWWWVNGGDGGFSPHFAQPSWSPDGRRLICLCDREKEPGEEGEAPWQVFVVNADGSGLTRLTSADVPVSRPKFHPDGRRWGYLREAGRRGDVILYTLTLVDGTRRVRLATSAEILDYAFCPCGAFVAISDARRGLVLRDLASGGEMVITPRQAGMDEFCGFTQLTWRPDWKVLAFRPKVVHNVRFDGGDGLQLNVTPPLVRDLNRVGLIRFEKTEVRSLPLDESFELSHWQPPTNAE
jgi:hypothetical protein